MYSTASMLAVYIYIYIFYSLSLFLSLYIYMSSWFDYRGLLLILSLSSPVYQVEMLSDLYAGFSPAS